MAGNARLSGGPASRPVPNRSPPVLKAGDVLNLPSALFVDFPAEVREDADPLRHVSQMKKRSTGIFHRIANSFLLPGRDPSPSC